MKDSILLANLRRVHSSSSVIAKVMTLKLSLMLNLRIIASFVLVTLILGIGTVAAQRDDRDQTDDSTITVGLGLEKALSVLERNGCNNPYGLAWAKPAPDQSIRAFQIDDGVVLAITFLDSTKTLLAMQMVFTTPVMAKANDRVVGLRRISFEPDGTYILHMLKQNKRDVKPAVPTPQLPKYTPAK
jgi:hypothetical protein